MATILVVSYNENGKRDVSTTYVKNCLFENNTSRSHSTIYIDEYGGGEILDSVFKNNKVTFFGGIVTLESCEYVLVKNSLFEGNSAIRGGGLYIVPYSSVQSNVDVIDCNFTRNSVSSHGGAIYANMAKLNIYSNLTN